MLGCSYSLEALARFSQAPPDAPATLSRTITVNSLRDNYLRVSRQKLTKLISAFPSILTAWLASLVAVQFDVGVKLDNLSPPQPVQVRWPAPVQLALREGQFPK
jgi:hypothetical protein